MTQVPTVSDTDFRPEPLTPDKFPSADLPKTGSQAILDQINAGTYNLEFLYPAALQLDFYKVGHVHQYPEGTECIYSNSTPRSDTYAKILLNGRVYDGCYLHFGLQAFVIEFLIDHWNKTFFKRPLAEVVTEWKLYVDAGLNTDVNAAHIAALHTLGFLPIEIRALAEGTLVPMRVPTYTVHSTLRPFAWVTNALETVMSSDTWKVGTVATIARNFRMTNEYWARINGSPAYMFPYQTHDFSARGMSGHVDAATSGVAHEVSSSGTDTVGSLPRAALLYGANGVTHNVGQSINATEHSVMCIDGQNNELATFERILDLYPTGPVSIVSDSFDFWKVLSVYAVQLKDKIMAREGRLVFRPDSGNPLEIITGTALVLDSTDVDYMYTFCMKNYSHKSVPVVYRGVYYWLTMEQGVELENAIDIAYSLQLMTDVAPQVMGAYVLLGKIFGWTENAQGYRDLDTHVGLVYGEKIVPRLYDAILEKLTALGWSHSNLVVGVGSFSYQYLTRDTFGIAVKATYGVVKGVGRGILKNPKTDDGMKKSAWGLLSVHKDADGKLYLEDGGLDTGPDDVMDGNFESGELIPLFRNSKLLSFTTMSEVRQRVWGWDDSRTA